MPTKTLVRLELRLSTMHTLSGRFQVLDNLRDGIQEEARNSAANATIFLDWIKSQMNLLFTDPTVAMASADDGADFAQISSVLPTQEVFNK